MSGRQCNLCKAWKPDTSFERVRQRYSERFSLRSYCKACRKDQEAARRLNPKPKQPTFCWPQEGLNHAMQSFLQGAMPC